jgi:hypothetical protein
MSHYMEVKDSDYNVLREVIELLNKNKSWINTGLSCLK